MSRVTELAHSFGFHSWINHGEELEAFYHAARAEALRDAADRIDACNTLVEEAEWSNGYSTARADTACSLRAMADREGK